MRRATAILVSFGLLAFIAVAADAIQSNRNAIQVPLINPNGREIGRVTLQPAPRNKLLVVARVRGLRPGFHGFHIHEHGRCEVTDEGDFVTAGGHFDTQPGRNHGDHAGDLPVLLADANGRAILTFHSDRVHLRQLLAADGTAVIIHAGADNFANIPRRYGRPDETTLANGDSGARVACGVIKRG